jgi:Transposase, Mutator family
MTVRDIRAHLREMYDVDVSPDLISRVTDGVLEELAEWQSRPLDAAGVAHLSATSRHCSRRPSPRAWLVPW